MHEGVTFVEDEVLQEKKRLRGQWHAIAGPEAAALHATMVERFKTNVLWSRARRSGESADAVSG